MKNIRPKVTLLVIMALFIVPLAVAWMMYSGSINFQPEATRNLGSLLVPTVPIRWEEVENPELDSESPGLYEHWVILFPMANPCDDDCLESITSLRQVHIASGREQNRIRIALLTENSSAATEQQISEIYSQFQILRNPGREVFDTLKQINQTQDAQQTTDTVYLVDPLGNIMMTYSGEDSPSHLSKDLKRLLTWSKQDKRS